MRTKKETFTDRSGTDAVPRQHHAHICTCLAAAAGMHQHRQNEKKTFCYLQNEIFTSKINI